MIRLTHFVVPVAFAVLVTLSGCLLNDPVTLVFITSPEPGAMLTEARPVTIEAYAPDHARITHVDFYDGETRLATRHEPPFSYPWPITAADNGEHRLSIAVHYRFEDDSEAILHAREVPVTVSILPLRANIPSRRTGETYFACDCQSGATPGCAPGDDANEGTSPGAAWRSYDKLNSVFRAASCGETFLFCEGGAFEHTSSNWNAGQLCDVGNEIIVESYDPGSVGVEPPRPIISVAGSSFLQISSSTHIGGYQFESLHIRCLSDCSGKEGIWLLGGVHRFTVRDFEIEGFHDGVSCHPSPNSNDDFVLEDSVIHHNLRQGFFGGAPRAVIQGNTFYSNGKPIFDHAIYQAGTDPGEIGKERLVDMQIVDNVIYDNATDPSTGKCEGTQIEFRGGTRLVIARNYIFTAPGAVGNHCWGITGTSSQNGYGTEGCIDCTIAANRIENHPVGISVNGHEGGEIENNIIAMPDESGLYGCTGIALIGQSDTPTNRDLLIRNNSIWIGRTQGDPCRGIQIREGDGHRIYSNAIKLPASHASGRAGSCLSVYSPAAFAGGGTDYNVCHPGLGTFGQSGGVGKDLASWRSSTGRDGASLQTSPRFNAPGPPSHDFGLRPDSKCIDAGHPTMSTPEDALGARRRGTRDAGALESAL